MLKPPIQPKRSLGAPSKRAATGLTRAEAARVLELTLSGVRYLEETRRLRARKGPDGVHRFRAADVEALRGQVHGRARRAAGERAPSEGAVAARAFGLLAEGADWRELVRVLELEPDAARALAESYRAPGELVLPAAVVDELGALGAVDAGGAVSGRSIVALLRRLRDRLRAARAPRPGGRRAVDAQPPNAG
jgi:hypothetical protein